MQYLLGGRLSRLLMAGMLGEALGRRPHPLDPSALPPCLNARNRRSVTPRNARGRGAADAAAVRLAAGPAIQLRERQRAWLLDIRIVSRLTA